ncbi:MAG: hypothetical protein WCP03_02405 [Candidatus Saccharibacteria bacterium]
MNNKSQIGFSAIIAILIVVIVGIIGFTGWYIYNAAQKDKKLDSVSNEQDQQQATIDKNQDNNTTQISNSTPVYLKIKEWEIQIPLNKEINDATYFYKSIPGGGDVVYLSTKSITSKYPNCGQEKSSLGSYDRFLDPNKALLSTTYGQAYPDAKKVGQYYYYYSPAQASCTDNETNEQTTIPLRSAFEQVIKSVKPL